MDPIHHNDDIQILVLQHNEYIHYLCTQGVWGALTYLGFLGSIFTLAFMHMKNNSKILAEICKELVSEMVENGFYEKNLSVEQLERLKKIKELQYHETREFQDRDSS